MSQDLNEKRVEAFNRGARVTLRSGTGAFFSRIFGGGTLDNFNSAVNDEQIGFNSHKEVAEFLKTNMEGLNPEKFQDALKFYAANNETIFTNALSEAGLNKETQNQILDWSVGLNLPQKGVEVDKNLAPKAREEGVKTTPAKVTTDMVVSKEAVSEPEINQNTTPRKNVTAEEVKGKGKNQPKNFETSIKPQGRLKKTIASLRKSAEPKPIAKRPKPGKLKDKQISF